jgi:hypothetical protein
MAPAKAPRFQPLLRVVLDVGKIGGRTPEENVVLVVVWGGTLVAFINRMARGPSSVPGLASGESKKDARE